MKTKKWTIEELEAHIVANCEYGSAIVCGALFKKLYGFYPKIGLSGFQAEAIDAVLKTLPEPTKAKRHEGIET